MAFLFKSKKNADRAQNAKENGVAGSQASLQSSNGRTVKEKENTTPGSSVNNSMNSLGGGTATPSPEQTIVRRAASSEQQVSDLPVSRP